MAKEPAARPRNWRKRPRSAANGVGRGSASISQKGCSPHSGLALGHSTKEGIDIVMKDIHRIGRRLAAAGEVLASCCDRAVARRPSETTHVEGKHV